MINLELSTREKENLTDEEIAKARKLELLILPYLKRNINFFYAGGNIPNKAKAYNTKMDDTILEEKIKHNKASMPAVCKPLCEMVSQILQENGIKAETVSCDTDMFKHVDVLLTTKNGKKYIINYLEDIENIQTNMRTPDFASREYYERRYKKFENGVTTDNKSLDGISFLERERLEQIDSNLGYKKYNMYMDEVIKQIGEEFKNFRNIMSENEYLTEEMKNGKKRTKEEIYVKWQNMSENEILEKKLDWIFDYFNDRMNITGHADFVMYYSRLLLKRVLSPKEYKKITRYDCFVNKKDIPEQCRIANILDYENDENKSKIRFCLLGTGNNIYAFSTKTNVYEKLNLQEFEDLKKYANITKSQKPSDLVLKLCDRGNALPLIFHPLGSKMLNDRANLIDNNLPQTEREVELEKLSNAIKTTDGEITSITIPYPDGERKYIYIDDNNEFVVNSKKKKNTTIYHYNEENDTFTEEIKKEEEGR